MISMSKGQSGLATHPTGRIGRQKLQIERRRLQMNSTYEFATDEDLCCSRRQAVTVFECSLYVARSSSVPFLQWEIIR